MTSTLVSSLELIGRVDEAALAYTLTRMKVLERIPGNPVAIAYWTLDGATALMARNLPSSSFNRVVGIRKGRRTRFDSWSNGTVNAAPKRDSK